MQMVGTDEAYNNEVTHTPEERRCTELSEGTVCTQRTGLVLVGNIGLCQVNITEAESPRAPMKILDLQVTEAP